MITSRRTFCAQVGALLATADLAAAAGLDLQKPGDAVAISGLVTLTPPGGPTSLLAFSSCNRFNGRFYLRDRSIEVVVDMEGLEIAPNSTVDLEEVLFISGNNRADLLARLA